MISKSGHFQDSCGGGEALRTAIHVCNRTSSKSVINSTPLSYGSAENPVYIHAWGCEAEARIYNPKAGKLDPRTSSVFFVGYLTKSKGFRFYSLHHHT